MNINLASSLRPLIGTWRCALTLDRAFHWPKSIFFLDVNVGKSQSFFYSTGKNWNIFQPVAGEIKNYSICCELARFLATPYTGSAKCAVGESEPRFGFIHADLHAKKASPESAFTHRARTFGAADDWCKCTRPIIHNEWALHQTPPDAASPRTHALLWLLLSSSGDVRRPVSSPQCVCASARASECYYIRPSFIQQRAPPAAAAAELVCVCVCASQPASQRVCVWSARRRVKLIPTSWWSRQIRMPTGCTPPAAAGRVSEWVLSLSQMTATGLVCERLALCANLTLHKMTSKDSGENFWPASWKKMGGQKTPPAELSVSLSAADSCPAEWRLSRLLGLFPEFLLLWENWLNVPFAGSCKKRMLDDTSGYFANLLAEIKYLKLNLPNTQNNLFSIFSMRISELVEFNTATRYFSEQIKCWENFDPPSVGQKSTGHKYRGKNNSVESSWKTILLLTGYTKSQQNNFTAPDSFAWPARQWRQRAYFSTWLRRHTFQ